MFFIIIFIITIIIFISLFYIKFVLPSHQSYENFTNESGSAFSSTTELLQYLLDNYLSFEDIVLFEKNGQKCAFLNTSPIQKQFKRFVVSQNESKLDEISQFFSKEQNNEDIIFKQPH